jgi:hypothetical protein
VDSIFELQMWLISKSGQWFLIDTQQSIIEDELTSLAKDRIALNNDYVPLLVEYKPSSVRIIKN